MPPVRDHGLFRKVEAPGTDVAMGGCYACYRSVPGIDTGVLIEYEGTLFLCNNCLKEMVEVAGMNVLEDAVKLERDLAMAQHALAASLQENEELEELLNTVASVTSPKPRPKAKPAPKR